MGVTISGTEQLAQKRQYAPSLAFRVAKAITNAAADIRHNGANLRTGLRSFDEIVERASMRTDINDHLTTLFLESLSVRPDLIVELGVRGGESTFVLERVAQLYGSKLLSLDIEDCSRASSYRDWSFVECDDIAFAQKFPGWCREHSIVPSIDVLFIDTSHEYSHTLAEINNWFPFLASRGKVFMHDTNLTKRFFRKDGSMGFAWDNHRGVIAALETYFGKKFDERHDFADFASGWLLRHYANCCGLTVLERAYDMTTSEADWNLTGRASNASVVCGNR
jgi:cephalosporin hydroxylase